MNRLFKGIKRAQGTTPRKWNLNWKSFVSSVFQNPSRSVGTKLFLVFVISIIVFVFSVGMISYFFSKNAIEDQASKSNYQTMVQAAQKIDLQLTQFNNMTMQIMFDPNLTASLKTLKDNQISAYEKIQTMEAITKTLQTYSVGNPLIENIYLIPIDPKRNTMAALGLRGNLDNLRKQAWFEEATKSNGQSIWVDTMPKGVDKAPEATFGIARPMRDLNSGMAEYIVLMEIRIATFSKSLEGINLGDGSTVQVMNRSGHYIYFEDDDKLTKEAPKWLMPHIEDTASVVSGSTKVASDSDGDMLLVYDQMPSSRWMLVGAVPVAELVKEAKSILTLTFISMLAAAVIAVVIGWLVIQWVATPLVKLRNLMNEGAQGNLAVRAVSKSKDEIGQLANGFNTMMEQITDLVKSTDASARAVLDTAAYLSEASRSTAISAKEIAIATEEIAKGATSLAVEAERGHDLTHNIASQMTTVIDANGQMDLSVQAVAESSTLGAANMTSLMSRTTSTGDMMRSLATKVNTLSDSTQSIRKILDVLHNMTKQTNILSLNATIEAARAGTAGKGFMVVADEIRNLADQSRQSIDVVGQITEKIQLEITETVTALSEAFPLFQKQAEAVQETDVIFSTVQQQMDGMIQQLGNVTGSIGRLNEAQSILVEAMSNVSAVAEEASATSEEVASLSTEQLNVSNRLVELSQQLEEVSSNLKETLSQFKY
ncbi:methyl-accepting chemotaxis protein [Paenibacillus alvei]|uniref:methyl-accepting chemotaxis protein n=2 Tax=Paenibacillus alvei TaxID=44250 RepID=UPI00227E549A|nr:methyl-accepting chemotaxis protein [Paenibacillus alvei]MCY9757101.1 methyl-accepting chemotaxis protein [Paenibacillus alvei]